MPDWSRLVLIIFTIIGIVLITAGLLADYNFPNIVVSFMGFLVWQTGVLIAIYMRLRN